MRDIKEDMHKLGYNIFLEWKSKYCKHIKEAQIDLLNLMQSQS